jgi:hypothetical protein
MAAEGTFACDIWTKTPKSHPLIAAANSPAVNRNALGWHFRQFFLLGQAILLIEATRKGE